MVHQGDCGICLSIRPLRNPRNCESRGILWIALAVDKKDPFKNSKRFAHLVTEDNKHTGHVKWNHELRKSRWKAWGFHQIVEKPDVLAEVGVQPSISWHLSQHQLAPTSRPHPWPPRHGLDGEGTLNDSIEATISVVIVVLRLRRPPWQDFHSAMAIEFWRSDHDHNTMNLNQLYIRFNHIQLPNYLDDSW